MAFRGSIVFILLIFCSFQNNELAVLSAALQKSIQNSLSFSAEVNISKTKLEVNAAGFVRYTEMLKNGQENYRSCNLNRFIEADYLGTSQNGMLILRTEKRDVIVQTYHDRAGDIDSMSTHLDIPLQGVEPEQLNAISHQLRRMRDLLQQKQ